MTIILRCRVTVRRLAQTPIKYIFSESLVIADYGGIFINIKISRFSKYSALFLKVQMFTNQVRFRSDLSRRTRLISLCLLVQSLNSPFFPPPIGAEPGWARPGAAPIRGGKKGEFRDWIICLLDTFF